MLFIVSHPLGCWPPFLTSAFDELLPAPLSRVRSRGEVSTRTSTLNAVLIHTVVENPATTTWFTGKPSADIARRATIVRRDVYVNYER
jgi:hypothetical protein